MSMARTDPGRPVREDAAMKLKLQNSEVETMKHADARAGLPFAQLLLLYLYPFALFKDVNRGPAHEKRRALFYNRARRWMLLSYARRWTLIAASFYLALLPMEALAAAKLPAAAVAVVCCLSLAVTACTLGAYVLLGAPLRSEP
jgi:hypothetical protein